MRWVWITAAVAIGTALGVLAGAAVALDTGEPEWRPMVACGLLGAFFGLLAGGVEGKWLDFIFGPKEPDADRPTKSPSVLPVTRRDRRQ